MQQGGEGLEVEKNREKGVIRRGGESLITRQREAGGAQRGQNKKRWIRRRGGEKLITRQREGLRGDKH